jgi:hypothetical protein
MLESKLV